ncbi:MAG: alpha-amylase [bacterium]|nr:alpha-amylase [bacterium]
MMESHGVVYAARELAGRMAPALASPGIAEPIRAGELLVAELVQGALRAVIDHYCADQNPGSLLRGVDWVRASRGADAADESARAFVELYPPEAGAPDAAAYLAERVGDRGRVEIAVEELVLLYLATANRAMTRLSELFADDELQRRAPYRGLVEGLAEFYGSEPTVAELDAPLFDCLFAPLKAAPDSLDGQLDYIRSHWKDVLPEEFLERVSVADGVVQEETRFRGVGPGPTEVLSFPGGADDVGHFYAEPERFSDDADWMSNVVLIAKSVHVWLDQLSRHYGRWIRRLDEIPDEELDRLARWGFNGVWLIGVWERSDASRRIKEMTGNPEAAASAYSLFDYRVAAELGGEEALANLRDRARKRGIHLASDMVPNHVGLFSKWVVEHPQWFVQLDHPPYPGYSFTGENLSHDDRVALFIEDGYWDRQDAAVVFKRIDRESGETRYIYHGNDGTSMPWNDTAQLNYLNPDVREAVLDTILHVARLFPIIRFDAAMTLTKRHYQRLWFPKPGDAGAVPSRAEHGMTRTEFDECMPEEFWRQVVDRIAAEAPNTLLLAEAFWLMEGFFVRTLGMHRVYNSAFMNMLKMEENANYRTTVKNVIEFSPQVLKRFVNFMSNPDEATAVEQFGRGDKYYGVAVMMATMPGLPMFGHGQVEGFTEKYGMEYRRAYKDEHPDDDMVRRHETCIFPLLRRRWLFSGVENFAFYDFHRDDGHVDENVFAHSNRAGDERAVVLYNNAFHTTQGRIKTSTAANRGSEEDEQLVRPTLAEALDLNTDDGVFYIVRDHKDGIEYIRSGASIRDEGLFVQLEAYQYHVFLDFREVVDEDGSWAQLAEGLAGLGVDDMMEAHRAMVLAPLLAAFREAVNGKTLAQLVADSDAKPKKEASTKGANKPAKKKSARKPKIAAPAFQKPMEAFLEGLAAQAGRPIAAAETIKAMEVWCARLREFPDAAQALDLPEETCAFLTGRHEDTDEREALDRIGAAWAILQPIGQALAPGIETRDDVPGAAAHWMDEWLMARGVSEAFTELGREEWRAKLDTKLVRIALHYVPVLSGAGKRAVRPLFARLLNDPAVRDYLYMNRFDGVLWLNREQLQTMVYWLFLFSVVTLVTDTSLDARARTDAIQRRFEAMDTFLTTAEKAHYQVEEIVAALSEEDDHE